MKQTDDKNYTYVPINELPLPKRLFRRFKQLILALGILAFGIFMIVILIKLKPKADKIPTKILAPLVKVQQVNLEDVEMIVKQPGTVTPKVEVEIVPQISGKIVWLNPNFKAGGFIKAEEEILRIDKRDYELAVQQAKSIVADAKVNLDIQKAEADVAIEEWQDLNPGTEPDSPLVLKEPQIQQAQARVESAKAQLGVAELNLERTSVSLPIDIRIVSETANLGQYITSGRSLGKAYGTEAVEIEVKIEDDDIAWFDVPEIIDNSNGHISEQQLTKAIIKAEFAGGVHTWEGFVKRTTGQIDRKTRMISVVVEVPDPFDTAGRKYPLLPGAFVEVSIIGNIVKNAAVIPRDALREGDNVWLVNNDRLHVKKLNVARADNEYAYVTDGIEDGALLVISSLEFAIDGMMVRLQADTNSQQITQSDTNFPSETGVD
ncbi:MAG: efflux RND transporter periplasmic adaptor subunit [Planctomycetota bacterium]|jgi:RND family efflux transporter MFP subunit